MMNFPDLYDALGIKADATIAGLIGGVISLSFLRDLTPFKAFLAILTGSACAAYLTPLVVVYFRLGESGEHAAAFLTGLLGMNILAGLFKLSERFRNEPIKTIKNLKGLDDDGSG